MTFTWSVLISRLQPSTRERKTFGKSSPLSRRLILDISTRYFFETLRDRDRLLPLLLE